MPWPSTAADYDDELEIGLVVATPLLDATVAEGEARIGGFVVDNDRIGSLTTTVGRRGAAARRATD